MERWASALHWNYRLKLSCARRTIEVNCANPDNIVASVRRCTSQRHRTTRRRGDHAHRRGLDEVEWMASQGWDSHVGQRAVEEEAIMREK
jgi:hypothetical protein